MRATVSSVDFAAMKSPTSIDVAKLVGVSQSTVSRALRDDPAIPIATRARIRHAAARLGYVPSQRGRSLATRSTGHIAVLVSDLGNPFYTEAIQRLHAAFAKTGHRLVVLADPSNGLLQPAELLDGSFDGAILATSLLGSTLPLVLQERGLAVVMFNRTLDSAVLDVCVSDNTAGARMAADELVELGHRRFGAIFGPPDTSTGRDREAGFRAGLAASGLTLDDELVSHGPFSEANGRIRMLELLGHGKPPSAVFCGSDVIAIGALNAARSMQRNVPEEISVVGFDDIAAAGWNVVDLTTVRQNLPGMADAAAQLLLSRVEDIDRAPRRVVVPTQFVRRGSHSTPPA